MHPENTLEKNLLHATKSIEWNVFLGLSKPNPLNLLTKSHLKSSNSLETTSHSPFQSRKKISSSSSESISNHLSPNSLMKSYENSSNTHNFNSQQTNFQHTGNDYFTFPLDYSQNQFQTSEINNYHNYVDYQMKFGYSQQPFDTSGDKLQLIAKFAPLLETIRLLQRPDKPQVLLSMLGGRCDWKNMGYPKLRDYVLDAYQHGFCLFGGHPPQEFVFFFIFFLF